MGGVRAGLWAGLLGAALLSTAAGTPAAGNAGAATGPGWIARENALPGDPGWRLVQPARPAQLAAYASHASAAAGEEVRVHARADGARTLTWALYRMGWYGGAEGRRVAEGGPVAVGPRPTPAPDPVTGLVACDWPATFAVTVSPDWTTGIFLFVLTRDDGPQTYVPLVVRDGTRRGAAVYQASVTTWQAYNGWGGKSLYRGGPAVEVSFDRPYDEGNGAGQYFLFEHDLVRWAERRGYDAVYATNLDLDADPALLEGQRLFLSVGHDEYWTRTMRERVEAALDHGVHAAFLGSNAVYWHVRLEPSRDGSARPRRTLVCWKFRSAEEPHAGTPLETVRFRDAQLAWPENALLGVMYVGWFPIEGPFPWIVRNAGHWLYEGTGARDGDAIPGIVAYEVDRTVPNGRAPAGVEVIARSPVVLAEGQPEHHEAAVHVRPSGAILFAAGTNAWSWGLSRPGVADARVERVMENLLARAGVRPGGEVVAPPPWTDPPPPPVAAPAGGCGVDGAGLGSVALVLLAGLAWRRRSRGSPPLTPPSPRCAGRG
jgi:hypothetical protein